MAVATVIAYVLVALLVRHWWSTRPSGDVVTRAVSRHPSGRPTGGATGST